MCSVVFLRRPGAPWPVLIAANRDEMADRPWRPPARHWPDRPNVTAGLDELAEGSWMGVNDEGLVAAILNRRGTLGPQTGKRSRGELVLDALDFADAKDAAEALRDIDTRAYRPFNLLLADNRDAFVVSHRGENLTKPAKAGHRPQIAEIPPGLHMLTAFDLNDPIDPRIVRYRAKFADAPVPDPAAPASWRAWEELLGSRQWDGEFETGAMNFHLSNGFGTVSSSLAALPAPGVADNRPTWRFCPGRPDEAAWGVVL